MTFLKKRSAVRRHAAEAASMSSIMMSRLTEPSGMMAADVSTSTVAGSAMATGAA